MNAAITLDGGRRLLADICGSVNMNMMNSIDEVSHYVSATADATDGYTGCHTRLVELMTPGSAAHILKNEHDVLIEVYQNNRTYYETAEVLGISRNSVGGIVRAALKKLSTACSVSYVFTGSVTKLVKGSIWDAPVEELNFLNKDINLLRRCGFKTLSPIKDMTVFELIKIKGIGVGIAERIELKVEELNGGVLQRNTSSERYIVAN